MQWPSHSSPVRALITKPYLLQLILALLTLTNPRSNSGGLLSYYYFDKHTLFCVRYTYCLWIFYIVAILHCFTDHFYFVHSHIHTHDYLNIRGKKHWPASSCAILTTQGGFFRTPEPPSAPPMTRSKATKDNVIQAVYTTTEERDQNSADNLTDSQVIIEHCILT